MEVCPMSQTESSNYSSQFRQDAVNLAVESDQSVAQTARDLGVNSNTLYTWISKYKPQKSSSNKTAGEEHIYDELKRLRRENDRLKEERDILKKAAAYFAENSR
jgi:transposase